MIKFPKICKHISKIDETSQKPFRVQRSHYGNTFKRLYQGKNLPKYYLPYHVQLAEEISFNFMYKS